MHRIFEEALGDVLQFSGDTAISKSGRIRLEQVDETYTLSLALPDPSNPAMNLLPAVAHVFLKCAASSYKHADSIFITASQKFGSGYTGTITERFSDGIIRISFDSLSFVYEVSVKRHSPL